MDMGTYPEYNILEYSPAQHFGDVREMDVRLEHFPLGSKIGMFLHYARTPAISARIIEKGIVFAFLRSKLFINDLTQAIRHLDCNQ